MAGVVAASSLPVFRVDVTSTVGELGYSGYGYGEANQRRAKVGMKAVARFAKKHYGSPVDRADVEMAASDLICDILHFAHTQDIDPAYLLEKVGRSFEGDFEDDDPADVPVKDGVVGRVAAYGMSGAGVEPIPARDKADFEPCSASLSRDMHLREPGAQQTLCGLLGVRASLNLRAEPTCVACIREAEGVPDPGAHAGPDEDRVRGFDARD